jgi:hypothetical protein
MTHVARHSIPPVTLSQELFHSYHSHWLSCTVARDELIKVQALGGVELNQLYSFRANTVSEVDWIEDVAVEAAKYEAFTYWHRGKHETVA